MALCSQQRKGQHEDSYMIDMQTAKDTLRDQLAYDAAMGQRGEGSGDKHAQKKTEGEQEEQEERRERRWPS